MRQLLTLSRLRLLYQWTGEDVVGAVVAGNQEAKRHLAPIRAPLVEMLSSSALLTFTKTMDLTYEHDHLFESAKIITDIRPVFAEDASDIVAAVITYTLTLGYYSGGKYRRLSIAMDSKDLQKMGEQCARAEKKGVRVQALVQSGLAVGAVIAGHDEDDGDQ